MTAMFSQFANTPAKKSRKSVHNLPRTTAFVQAISAQGLRLSYGGLSTVALHFGEVKPSGQSLGQRGIGLVKALPDALQPMVCRGGNPNGETHGTYHKKAVESWTVEPRADLETLPVIGKDVAAQAAQTWLASLDQETGEPLAETETETETETAETEPTGLESDDDPTDDTD